MESQEKEALEREREMVLKRGVQADLDKQSRRSRKSGRTGARGAEVLSDVGEGGDSDVQMEGNWGEGRTKDEGVGLSKFSGDHISSGKGGRGCD